MTAQPLYTTDILRLAAALDAPHDLGTEAQTAEVRSPTCGSVIRTSVVVDEQGRVAAISQDVRACAFGQASAALTQRNAIGKSREELSAVLAAFEAWLGGGGDAPDWPGVDALAPARPRNARHGAILLPLRALLAELDAR